MSRLDALFAACRAEGRAALVGYLPVGFPSYEASVDGTMTGETVVGAVTSAGVAIGGALASGVAAERIVVRS